MNFEVMRENCISIHQQIFELLLVADYIGLRLPLIVSSADELKTHPDTKSWDGMGRYAKTIYDDTYLWNILPQRLWIKGINGRQEWIKDEARAEFLDCFYHLGGDNLYKSD